MKPYKEVEKNTHYYCSVSLIGNVIGLRSDCLDTYAYFHECKKVDVPKEAYQIIPEGKRIHIVTSSDFNYIFELANKKYGFPIIKTGGISPCSELAKRYMNGAAA